MREIGHFIGGKEAAGASGRSGDVFNPNTGEVQAKVAFASKSEVERAIADAEAAQPAWAATNPQRRARVLFKFLELVQKEFGDLPGVSVEEVKDMLDSGQRIQFIDARPKHYVTRTQDIIDGATWRDPERVNEWAGELSKTDPVVVFCVYGFHIGCQTAGVLREAGFDAKYMNSGHSGWRAVGAPVKLFP